MSAPVNLEQVEAELAEGCSHTCGLSFTRTQWFFLAAAARVAMERADVPPGGAAALQDALHTIRAYNRFGRETSKLLDAPPTPL